MNINENTIMVMPLDAAKLVKMLTRELNYMLRSDQKFRVDNDAILGGPDDGPHNCILDSECCYNILAKGATFQTTIKSKAINGEYCYRMPVYIDNKITRSISFNPVLEFYISVPYLMKSFVKESKSLKEFMGSRYNYNPRIITNMREFIEAIRRSEKESE